MDIGTGRSSYFNVGYSVCFLRNIGKLQPRNTRPHVTRMSETRCGSWTRVDRPLFPPATLSHVCLAEPVHKRIASYGSVTILTCTFENDIASGRTEQRNLQHGCRPLFAFERVKGADVPLGSPRPTICELISGPN